VFENPFLGLETPVRKAREVREFENGVVRTVCGTSRCLNNKGDNDELCVFISPCAIQCPCCSVDRGSDEQ
jgi:hypothetical protein